MYREVSIVQEIDRSIKYLRLGLAEIQNISPANDFYDPVFIYLSGGLERLFKTMLCLNFQEQNSRLPNQNEVWSNSNGHDLNVLKSKVEEICIPISTPFASMDYEIITRDKFIEEVCTTLSAFGKRARYFNLDAILGVDQDFDTKKSWEKMETAIGKEIHGEKRFTQFAIDSQQIDKVYLDTNKEIVIRLEKFFRALTRQFIFGDFSSKSKTFLFQIEAFSDIDDDQLGITKYGKFGIYERIERKDQESKKENKRNNITQLNKGTFNKLLSLITGK